eukprot:179835-Prymnesium_polylepis.1
MPLWRLCTEGGERTLHAVRGGHVPGRRGCDSVQAVRGRRPSVRGKGSDHKVPSGQTPRAPHRDIVSRPTCIAPHEAADSHPRVTLHNAPRSWPAGHVIIWPSQPSSPGRRRRLCRASR